MCYYFSYQKTASLSHLHFSYLFPLCPRKHPEAHGPGHSSSLRTTTGLSQLALLARHVQAAWRGCLCGRHWKEYTMGNELPSTREAARPPLFSPSLLAALASCVLRGGGDGGLRTACGVRAVTVLLGAGAQGTGPCEDREWETNESPHCSGMWGGLDTALQNPKPPTSAGPRAANPRPEALLTAQTVLGQKAGHTAVTQAKRASLGASLSCTWDLAGRATPARHAGPPLGSRLAFLFQKSLARFQHNLLRYFWL